MNRLWIVLAVLAALFVFARIRARRRAQPRRSAPLAGPRIQGAYVSAWVHPRMGPACLHDSGLQFGKGFRRKEGPELPHDEECGCTLMPFSFTSSEVFNGALRNLNTARMAIADMNPAQGDSLVERLREVEAGPLAADPAAYAAAVAPERFPAGLQDALRAFLAERHAFLSQARGHADADGPAPTTTLETNEPT